MSYIIPKVPQCHQSKTRFPSSQPGGAQQPPPHVPPRSRVASCFNLPAVKWAWARPVSAFLTAAT